MPQPNTNPALGVGNVDIVYAIQNLKASTTSSVTIASGQTISGEFAMNGDLIIGMVIPSNWDSGNITIMGAEVSGGTFVDVYDSYGVAVTAVVGGSSRVVSLVGNHLQSVANIPFIKLKSASAVGAERTIKLMTKG